MPIHELLERLLGIARGAWRFRWLGALTAWFICAAGWAAVWLMPDTYESRARLFVDSESVLRPLLQGLAVNSDVMSQVNMVRAVVMSRDNLERVAKETGLADRATSRAEYETMIAGLPLAIELTPTSRDSTFEIAFRDTDPSMAQRVVESMLQSFVAGSSSLKVGDTEKATQFLEEQLKAQDAKMSRNEELLADFKRRNVGMLPAQNIDYYQRLQVETEALRALQAKMQQAEDKRKSLLAQLEGEEPTFGLIPSTSETGALDAQITALEKERDALLGPFTENHPRVTEKNQQIKQLEERRNAVRLQRQGRTAQPTSDPSQIAMRALDVNPVYQGMKTALSSIETEIAGLRTQIGQQQSVVSELRGRVDTMPKVEAEMTRLTRNVEMDRRLYNDLLQRKDSAQLSNDVQQSPGQVKVRTLDAPLVPRDPVSPPRALLITAILFLAVAVGTALAIVLNLLKPVFSSKNEIQGALGLPVIGSVQRFRPLGSGVLSGERLPIVFVMAMMVAAYVAVVFFTVIKPLGAPSP